MAIEEIWRQFYSGLLQTSFLEFVAVIAGIVSVWFSKQENILVYPIGLINTLAFIYISIEGHLYGEASVNVYYTIVSIYGWILWSKKDNHHQSATVIEHSNRRQIMAQLVFFSVCYVVIYAALRYLKKDFAPGAIPWADALASASAYTGMWLMARKKVESWYWWIVTNISSIPLYFVKGYVFTTFQYLVLLILAVAGLLSWIKKAEAHKWKQ